MKKIFILIIVFLLIASILYSVKAETEKPQLSENNSKTKLELFQSQTGSVLIKGYSNIGKITGLGTIDITAMEFTDASTNKKQSGIMVEIETGESYKSSGRSFIDYDEIMSLIKGVDYISNIKNDITKLNQYEVTYTTKDYFKITIFNNEDGLNCAVSIGYISPICSFISMEQFKELQRLIDMAKIKLDNIK